MAIIYGSDPKRDDYGNYEHVSIRIQCILKCMC